MNITTITIPIVLITTSLMSAVPVLADDLHMDNYTDEVPLPLVNIALSANDTPHTFTVDPKGIGVRVKSAVKTLEVTTAVQGKEWAECTSLQIPPAEPPVASLIYKEKLSNDEKFAKFEARANGKNCSFAELMNIAAKLETLDNVTAAGLILTSLMDGRIFLLTREARGKESVLQNESPWIKLAPDPFDPESGLCLLRLKIGNDPLVALAANSGAVQPILIPVTLSEAEAGFDKWLEKQKSDEQEFKAKFAVNSVGDEAATTRNTKLSLGFEGSQGDYPAKFTVTLGAQVEFKNEVVEEDVTKINAKYEYHFEPWLSVFGYVERLTDDFLNIDQRYESGIGTKFHFTTKSKVVDAFCVGSSRLYHKHHSKPKDVLVTRNTREMLNVFRSKIERELIDSQTVKKETREDYCRYKRGIEKRNARFEAALGVSFFADYEEPSALKLSTTPKVAPGADMPEAVTGQFTPPSSQRNRLSVSPSVRFRPNGRLSIFAEYSYKPAFDNPRKVRIGSMGRGFEEVRDTRQDSYAEIVIDLIKSRGDGLDVSLKVSWDESNDAVPPQATGEQARKALELGELTAQEFANAYSPIEGLRANSTHSQFKVGVTINL